VGLVVQRRVGKVTVRLFGLVKYVARRRREGWEFVGSHIATDGCSVAATNKAREMERWFRSMVLGQVVPSGTPGIRDDVDDLKRRYDAAIRKCLTNEVNHRPTNVNVANRKEMGIGESTLRKYQGMPGVLEPLKVARARVRREDEVEKLAKKRSGL
jgi:hypothetical protein